MVTKWSQRGLVDLCVHSLSIVSNNPAACCWRPGLRKLIIYFTWSNPIHVQNYVDEKLPWNVSLSFFFFLTVGCVVQSSSVTKQYKQSPDTK